MLVFLDVNLERLVVRGMFGVATAFLFYCEIRSHIGKDNALLSWYDWPITAAFFALLSVAMVVAVAASAGYPFLLIGFAVITALLWKFRLPELRTVHNVFFFFWLPPALYCCLCMWWMNYMQHVIPPCKSISATPCPAMIWFSPVDNRYGMMIPRGGDSAVVIYNKREYWETYPLYGGGLPTVRRPGLIGRIAENSRDGKLYFLSTSFVPSEKLHFDSLLRQIDVKNDFRTIQTLDLEKIAPFEEASHVSAVYFLEKTRELFIAGSGNEIRIFSEPGLKPVKFFNIPNLNLISRYIVRDNIYNILVSDDRKIYTAEWTGFVSIIDPDQGRAVRKKFFYAPVGALAMSPNGDTLFALTVSGRLYFLSPSDLSVKNVVKLEFGTRQLTSAPSLHALFAGSYTTGNVTMVDTDTGAAKMLFNAGERIQGLFFHPESRRLFVSSACGVFAWDVGRSGADKTRSCPQMSDNVTKAMSHANRVPDYMFPALNPSPKAFGKYFRELWIGTVRTLARPLVVLSLMLFAFLYSQNFGFRGWWRWLSAATWKMMSD
ncbi:MAG: hypothetical protein ABIH66_13715 [bacterium]